MFLFVVAAVCKESYLLLYPNNLNCFHKTHSYPERHKVILDSASYLLKHSRCTIVFDEILYIIIPQAILKHLVLQASQDSACRTEQILDSL